VGGTDWVGVAQDRGQVASCCECGNEPAGSIKCRPFIWLAEELLASHEGLWCMELKVTQLVPFGNLS